MTNIKKIWFILIILLLVIVGIYCFVSFVSSGTHGLIEEFPSNKNKNQIKNKIDSLVNKNDRVRYVENDYTEYYDLVDIYTGVIFSYKIMERGENKSSIALVYIKKDSEEQFKTRSELNKTEMEYFSELFLNLIIRPINENDLE